MDTLYSLQSFLGDNLILPQEPPTAIYEPAHELITQHHHDP